MADGRKKNGGARNGAGRKSKAEEMELQSLLDRCWTQAARESCITKLAKDANSRLFTVRHEARKLLMAYTFGKPVEHKKVTGDSEQPIKVLVEYVGTTPNTDEG